MPNTPDTPQPATDIDPKRLALVATATRNMALILDASGWIEWSCSWSRSMAI